MKRPSDGVSREERTSRSNLYLLRMRTICRTFSRPMPTSWNRTTSHRKHHHVLALLDNWQTQFIRIVPSRLAKASSTVGARRRAVAAR